MDSADGSAASGPRVWMWRAVLVLVLAGGFFAVHSARSLLVGAQSKGHWAQTRDLLQAYGTEELDDPNALRHISDELWERPWLGYQDIRRWHLVLDAFVFGAAALVLLDRIVVSRDRQRLAGVPDRCG